MRIVAILILLIPFLSKGQNYFREHFGGSIGIVFSVGTHVNNIGVSTNFYYTDYFFQVNATNTFTLIHQSYGGRKRFWENRSAAGVILLTGKQNTPVDFMIDGLNHQTNYDLGAGFNYIWYFDNQRTSQRSGAFVAHIKSFSIAHENDVFGGLRKDRFRTAHLRLNYRYQDFRFGLGVNLWTGETANSRWEHIHLDKCPNGFRILEDLPYGKTSHGILYASVRYRLPYGQNVQMRLGTDSEGIRHGFQNRLIHDLIFLPKKIERTTPHYPRLDKYGCPVFEKEGTRKNKLFLQFGTNENASY